MPLTDEQKADALEKARAAKIQRAKEAEAVLVRQANKVLPKLPAEKRLSLQYINGELAKGTREDADQRLLRDTRADIIKRYAPKDDDA
jgi:hypothetical protein